METSETPTAPSLSTRLSGQSSQDACETLTRFGIKFLLIAGTNNAPHLVFYVFVRSMKFGYVLHRVSYWPDTQA